MKLNRIFFQMIAVIFAASMWPVGAQVSTPLDQRVVPDKPNPNGEAARTQFMAKLISDMTIDTGKLSGSDVTTEDACLKTDTIFTGQITEIGQPTLRPALRPNRQSDYLTFHGVAIKVIQVLKGTQESPVSVESFIKATPRDSRESPPKVGIQYIFFTKVFHEKNTVFKILPATDDNIAKVKALIAAAPAPK
jgi:hypothetical protein